MKRVIVFFMIGLIVLSFSACKVENTLEYFDDQSNVANNYGSSVNGGVQSTEAVNTSPYAQGTFKVYAKNADGDYYDMLFHNNRIVYVDLEDSNGYFNENCKGTFGKDAPNHIHFSGMVGMSVEDVVKFFEEKGFELTITQEE